MPRLTGRGGFTLVELLIVLVLTGIILGIAANSFRGLENTLRSGSSEVTSFLRQARSSAVAATSAYRVVVTSTTRLRTEFAPSCAASVWQPDTRITLDLRDGVVLEGAAIVADSTLLCFDTRGLADASPTFVLRDREGRAERVDVFLGGAVTTTPVP
jgi:prepilin-type N-terminal cleavage/methylation domain-containing protein